MERIFKIKTKSNRDYRCQYPSERRYSASIVIGLSVVFSQLFLYSLIMGSLIVHKMTALFNRTDLPSTNDTYSQEVDEEVVIRLWEKVGRDLKFHNIEYSVNMPVLVCSGCFLMSLGYLLSFGTGCIAWKRWYIDHNITFFFIASTFSTLTSSISLSLCCLACLDTTYNFDSYSHRPNLTFSLLTNITLLSVAGVVWSLLSTRVAYKGMKRDYPDDMVINKGGGRVVVSTVTKGNKNCKAFPPDIISHFPAGDKLTKYLPKKDEGGLPKAESTLEYRQRVDKFLEGSNVEET